jgi:hypothetical protein
MFLVWILAVVPARADTYVPVGSPVYDDLRRLEAEGVIDSAMMATLPLSRREVSRLVSEALYDESQLSSAYLRTLLLRLEKEFTDVHEGEGQLYLRPLDEMSAEYLYAEEHSLFLDKNRHGQTLNDGSTVFATLTARIDSPNYGAVITPEMTSNDNGTFTRMAQAYVLKSFGREEFFVGKADSWWGPGQNGALLLSNNAQPVAMLKISNSIPYEILGTPVRGTFFISRLEDERNDVEGPIFYGLRLDMKPSRFLEVGVSKTAFFGGEGRDESFSAFLDSLFGKGENADSADDSEPGDQKAGIDFKLIVPWSRQPFTLYGEMAGEDEAGGLPSRFAYLWGIYLPRLLGLERLELWGEYATTDIGGHPGYWYSHHIYTDGYTYKDHILGHYIGSDAKDLFVRGRYNLDNASVTLSYEHLKKDYPDEFTFDNFTLELSRRFSKGGEIKVKGYYSQDEQDNLSVEVGLRYVF